MTQDTKQQEYKRKEALFRKTVRDAHQLFCNCSDPVHHLLGWRTSTGGLTEGATTVGDVTMAEVTGGAPTGGPGGQDGR